MCFRAGASGALTSQKKPPDYVRGSDSGILRNAVSLVRGASTGDHCRALPAGDDAHAGHRLCVSCEAELCAHPDRGSEGGGQHPCVSTAGV